MLTISQIRIPPLFEKEIDHHGGSATPNENLYYEHSIAPFGVDSNRTFKQKHIETSDVERLAIPDGQKVVPTLETMIFVWLWGLPCSPCGCYYCPRLEAADNLIPHRWSMSDLKGRLDVMSTSIITESLHMLCSLHMSCACDARHLIICDDTSCRIWHRKWLMV